MALINRVSRLFRADLHAVLDRIEEPEVLLRQAVREMEEELAGEERRIKVLNHELGQLMARGSDLDRSLREIDQELDVCFASERDDLARALFRRQLEAQRFRKFLTRKREILEESLDTLKARIEENRARLETLRQKGELLSEAEAPSHSEECWRTPDLAVRDEDVEVAFLREKQRRSRP